MFLELLNPRSETLEGRRMIFFIERKFQLIWRG